MSCCGMVASPGFHSQTRALKKDGRLHYKLCGDVSVCLQFLWISQAIQHGNRVCAMTWLKWRLEYCFWKQPDEKAGQNDARFNSIPKRYHSLSLLFLPMFWRTISLDLFLCLKTFSLSFSLAETSWHVFPCDIYTSAVCGTELFKAVLG